ncbi:hypothetical protein [Paenibacillus sp. NPDC057967]
MIIVIVLLLIILGVLLHINHKIPPRDDMREAMKHDADRKQSHNQ